MIWTVLKVCMYPEVHSERPPKTSVVELLDQSMNFNSTTSDNTFFTMGNASPSECVSENNQCALEEYSKEQGEN